MDANWKCTAEGCQKAYGHTGVCTLVDLGKRPRKTSSVHADSLPKARTPKKPKTLAPPAIEEEDAEVAQLTPSGVRTRESTKAKRSVRVSLARTSC